MKDYRKTYPGYLKKNIDHDYEHTLSKEDKDYLIKFDMEYYNGDYPKESIYLNQKFIDMHKNKKFMDLFKKVNEKRVEKEKPVFTFDEFIVNHYQKKGSSNKKIAERNHILHTLDADLNDETAFGENSTATTKANKAELNEKLSINEESEEKICYKYLKANQLDLYIKNKLIEFIDGFAIAHKTKLIDQINQDYSTATKANKFNSLYRILIGLKIMAKTKDDLRQLEILEKLFDTFVFKDTKQSKKILEA